ncbi:hypothetical protein SCHPADRAFT_1003419 [Schizopora paradoxa]|uniref:Uncharacterized protein n=1 Tax=Schizopora paradoxa TaxID=27342 RepID=A0A0H2QYJ3_9AGAM|nr:hypothetical protein SCHPADRAFT_1003419 [Schizopora paradoxa]
MVPRPQETNLASRETAEPEFMDVDDGRSIVNSDRPRVNTNLTNNLLQEPQAESGQSSRAIKGLPPRTSNAPWMENQVAPFKVATGENIGSTSHLARGTLSPTTIGSENNLVRPKRTRDEIDEGSDRDPKRMKPTLEFREEEPPYEARHPSQDGHPTKYHSIPFPAAHSPETNAPVPQPSTKKGKGKEKASETDVPVSQPSNKKGKGKGKEKEKTSHSSPKEQAAPKKTAAKTSQPRQKKQLEEEPRTICLKIYKTAHAWAPSKTISDFELSENGDLDLCKLGATLDNEKGEVCKVLHPKLEKTIREYRKGVLEAQEVQYLLETEPFLRIIMVKS